MNVNIGKLIRDSALVIEEGIGASLLEIDRIESQSMNSFECLRAKIYEVEDTIIIQLIIKHALPKSSRDPLMNMSTTLTVVPFMNLGDNENPCWRPLALHGDQVLQDVKPVVMNPNQKTVLGSLSFKFGKHDDKYKDLVDFFEQEDFKYINLYFTVQQRVEA
jgi:hypothetical protein